MTPPDHAIVIFGANGDLSRRMLLPSLFRLEVEGLMPDDYRVIGNSRSTLSNEDFRTFARTGIDEFGRCEVKEAAWKRFAARLSYVSHEFTPDDSRPVAEAVEKAEGEMGGDVRRLYYLAVPPSAFATITQAIGVCGLEKRARVVIEKPFGRDRESYRELSKSVREVLEESQVYRIDHFLGKETVQNILALRFANGMFEPSWNRQHIDHVQIDVPETLDIGTRASFYETTGALRDMIVTHLFQVLAFVAMEPPTAMEPTPLMNETAKIFESMVPLACENVVRGQYEGYRNDEGVDEDSETETFIAAKVCIDNWRWAGVPFYLRTGKCMAESRQTVTLAFREPPRHMFREAPAEWFQQDHLDLELSGEEGVSMTFLAKVPGPVIELAPARLKFTYEGSFGSELIGAYERLLHDALLGDRTLFTRGDGIERSWEIVEDILKNPPPLELYARGSWGPKGAVELIAPHKWRLPDGSSSAPSKRPE